MLKDDTKHANANENADEKVRQSVDGGQDEGGSEKIVDVEWEGSGDCEMNVARCRSRYWRRRTGRG